MKNILFLIFQTGDKANGGVKSITNVIKEITNFNIHIATQSETQTNEQWKATNAKVTTLPFPISMDHGISQPGTKNRCNLFKNIILVNHFILKYIKEHKIDAIHCNDPAPFFYIAAAAKLTRTPIILNLRDTKAKNEAKKKSKYRLMFEWADKILVLSKEMKSFYQSFTTEAKKIEVIYSIVDHCEYHPVSPHAKQQIRKRLNIAENDFAIGYVATFNSKKNQLGFLESFSGLETKMEENIKFYFLGDFNPKSNPYSAECLELATKSRISDNIEFVGFSDNISEWYKALNLVIIPTKKEGLARCMIESLSCGTPVISFDVSSAREILEANDCGTVVEQANYQSFFQAIVRMSNDSELMKRQSHNGARISKTLFSKKEIVSSYENLYFQVTNRKTR